MSAKISQAILEYHSALSETEKEICQTLSSEITDQLNEAENQIWHAHPVWFINGNPIVGYSKQKPGIRLMFWSGKSFEEEKLNVVGGKFQDASIFYNSVEDINKNDLKRWLEKAELIQWDYKNIIKRKGVLERLS